MKTKNHKRSTEKMSAESPRRTNKTVGHVVWPTPMTDKSFIENVTGFISDVVPQTYTNSPQQEFKEIITWARFEVTDANNPVLCCDSTETGESGPPLLLVLGYACGVQIWAILSNGEAREVLSWCQGIVRTLRLLPSPERFFGTLDVFASKRPLVALCDSAGSGSQFCSLSFVSLKTGDQVKNIKFKSSISDVVANRRVVVVTFYERIAVFDACTFEDRFTISSCYPSTGINPNPVSLGTRWLAYAEKELVTMHQSKGGVDGDGVHSYTATVFNAAKTLTKGLKDLSESVANSLTGQKVTGAMPLTSVHAQGVVTILDIRIGKGEVNVGEGIDGIIAHFVAHPNQPVVALSFDPSGNLLLTADKQGHDFHIFRIQPHINGSSYAAVHHLYVLHRGDTSAKVQDVAFSLDSRWVSVSTLRGTTHIFPITPYGGNVGVRTHTTHRVVNRLSRYHRTAGLDDASSGRNSPVLSGSPGSPRTFDPTVPMPYPNPCQSPFPHHILVNPLAQVRQSLLLSLTTSSAARSPQVSKARGGIPDESVQVKVAATFASPRGKPTGSPNVSKEKSHPRPVESLFVMSCHGTLIEYILEPRPAAGIPKDKICHDTPIEVEATAKAQWNLLRPSMTVELQPPLSSTNPLMMVPSNSHAHMPPEPESGDKDDRWLPQVEIVTHSGPPRRLWMGPQFSFKNTDPPSGGGALGTRELGNVTLMRSNPMNMPTACGAVPVLIEAGSASSFEQSPRLADVYGDRCDSDGSGPGTEVESRLRESIADAMMESPGGPACHETGRGPPREEDEFNLFMDTEVDMVKSSHSGRLVVGSVKRTSPQAADPRDRLPRKSNRAVSFEIGSEEEPCTLQRSAAPSDEFLSLPSQSESETYFDATPGNVKEEKVEKPDVPPQKKDKKKKKKK